VGKRSEASINPAAAAFAIQAAPAEPARNLPGSAAEECPFA